MKTQQKTTKNKTASGKSTSGRTTPKKSTSSKTPARKATSQKSMAQKTTMKKSDPVVHFEMPVKDRKRMAKFYTKAFGWQMQMLGEDMGNYVLATTAPVDRKGIPKQKGIINGGFFEKDEKKPAQYPSVVIAVESIKRSMVKINKAGGNVIGEPMEIPGFGMYVSFYDTEGNRVSIMEPTREMKAKAKGR
jgi:predicted enzyme related to lactoylglutathione lyase